MTKNEYIASIMLEAADLLKENQSLNEDINTMNLMYQNIYLADKLCESVDHLIDRYENDFYTLSESVGSTIWEGIKKIAKAIRDAWKWFIGLFTKNKQNRAKKDAQVVDPNKAKDFVDEVVDAYNNDKEIPELKVEEITKPVKEGQVLDNYKTLETKIESAVSKIEKETDEEKLKTTTEALKILNKITSETAKAAQLCLPPSSSSENVKEFYEYDNKGKLVKKTEDYGSADNPIDNYEYYYKNGRLTKEITNMGKSKYITRYDKDGMKKIYTNGDKTRYTKSDKNDNEINYRSFKGNTLSKQLPSDKKTFYVDSAEYNNNVRDKKKKAANLKKQREKEAKRKALKEAIDLLYDKAAIADTLNEATMYIDKAEQLEYMLEMLD